MPYGGKAAGCVTSNIAVTNCAPSLGSTLPSPSRGAAPSGRPPPKRLRAAWRRACSRSESWLLGCVRNQLGGQLKTRRRSHECLHHVRHGAVVGASARTVRKRLGNGSAESGSEPDWRSRLPQLPVCVSSCVLNARMCNNLKGLSEKVNKSRSAKEQRNQSCCDATLRRQSWLHSTAPRL